jgi:hypothetical protein
MLSQQIEWARMRAQRAWVHNGTGGQNERARTRAERTWVHNRSRELGDRHHRHGGQTLTPADETQSVGGGGLDRDRIQR